MPRPALDDSRYYFNRHESWLAFNRRVLEEALDDSNPLLERVKFLAITASNLDEFVEVRVAGLLQQVEHGHQESGPDGLTPQEQLSRLSAQLHTFVADQYDCWNRVLLPALAKEGIRVLRVAARWCPNFVFGFSLSLLGAASRIRRYPQTSLSSSYLATNIH
jgi:polyphosphate kinase